MSKVVKGVGRAIGKIVKGVGKVVKKIAKSKIGKIALVAATVYFGGAALMGGFGSSAAGGSFLSGMSSGLSSAASGISNAWTALTSGSLSGAGSALSSGFTGGATNAANWAASNAAWNAAPAAANAAPALTSAVEAAGATSPWTQTATGLNVLASEAAPAAASSTPGLISGAWNSLGPYGKAAAVSGGMQLGGALVAKKEAEQAREQEQEDVQAARDRFNTNIGTRLYSPATPYPVAPTNTSYAPVRRY